jgi:aldehyde dehydrogenase (NAD+)
VSEGVSCLINGYSNVGKWMSNDKRIPLISATGSTKMGREVSQLVAKRLGKTLLELGGNNAIIITPSADIKMTLIAILFGSLGTCAQRCTSTRRLIIHEDIYIKLVNALKKAYSQLKIGDPLDMKNHIGPLIDKQSVSKYLQAIEKADNEGANWILKGKALTGKGYESGCYVSPSIAEVKKNFSILQTETFSPILFLVKYSGNVENAIKIQNDVPQGLSSSIMTQNIKDSEIFLSHSGSDCGIANVNIGTSGAEIGGAFGGEKDTGGGRESGSDAWKIYMRRQTNTINYSSSLPLSQGIKFDI